MSTKKSFTPTPDQPHQAITIRRVYATQPDEERIVKALKLVVEQQPYDKKSRSADTLTAH